MGPHSGQSRQQILILRQLHLRLGIGRLCAFSKNIEDKAGAVEDLDLQFAFNVGHLFRCQIIVKDSHADIVVLHKLLDFLQFAFADKRARIRAVQSLQKAALGGGTGCISQKSEFVEIFIGFRLVLHRSDKSYEDSAFG